MPKEEKISPEDSALFRDSVDRLPDSEPEVDSEDDFGDDPAPRYAPSNATMHLGPDDKSFYHAPSFDVKKIRQLKTGKIAYEISLDLHGMTSDEAYNALLDFIEECRLNQQRCVRIVHGKGGKLSDKPILKNKVDYWLRQIPGVLAFVSALPKYGGTGALLVYLKRG